MKNILFIPLLVLSGCGISTYKSETLKETTYVPLSIKEQILGYTQGTCADGTLQQRFFDGGIGLVSNQDVYILQYTLIHNLDGTFALKTRTFKNNVEESAPSLQTGTYEITDASVDLENIGHAQVELGYRGSRMKLDISTAYGNNVVDLRSTWSKEDLNGTPFCP